MADQLSTSLVRGAGVSQDSTPFTAVNATAVSLTATPQAIKAAVTGKKHWVTSAIFENITAGEVANLAIQDGSTIKARYCLTGVQSAQVIFDPPIAITSGAAINAYTAANTGDGFITICGYVEN